LRFLFRKFLELMMKIVIRGLEFLLGTLSLRERIVVVPQPSL